MKEGEIIRTRETFYEDYGISKEEAEQLKEYCLKFGFEDHDLLLQAALSANRELAPDLYYSLARGVSYESMDRQQYLPIGKSGFYGHQRKALYIFKDLLRLHGKWQ